MNWKCLMLCVNILWLLACRSDMEKAETSFNTYFVTLNQMAEHINTEVKNGTYTDSAVIIVFVKKPQYSPNNNFIFDPYLRDLMDKSSIKQITCYTTNAKKCGYLGEISFQFEDNIMNSDKVYYFIYNRCDENKGYKKKFLSQKKMRKKWVVLIDET